MEMKQNQTFFSWGLFKSDFICFLPKNIKLFK